MQEASFEVSLLGTSIPCHYIKSAEHAEFIVNKLIQKNVLYALDTETEALPEYKYMNDTGKQDRYLAAGLSPHLAKIRLLQIYNGENSFVFDLKHIEAPELFIPFLEAKRFVAHNALFDLGFLKAMGVRHMNIGCTYLISKLLFHAVYPSDEGLSASLGAMVERILNNPVNKANQKSDWSYPELTFEQVEYAALDAVYVYKLAEKLVRGLDKFGLNRYYQLIKAVQHPVAEMQLNGLGLDVNAHKKLIDIWRVDLYKAKTDVLKMTGLKSLTAHTMAEWLEGNLPENVLAVWPKTETDKLKTDAHTFSDFAWLDVVKPFTEFQKKEKLTSSFGYNLLEQINPKTKKLHASFNICGARTGRFSCSKPNLQQLPRDNSVRMNFIPSEGNVFVCADFSQIELRVAAELSQDQAMLEAYRQGIDLHALTASKIMHKPLLSVTKEDRQLAKAFNFGLLFGLGIQKFSHYARKSYGVEVTKEEAGDAIQIFRETYSGYREWQLEQADNASTSFTCVTPCGKLRRLPEDNTFGNSMNHPVQGGAAEIMCHALVRINAEIQGLGMLVNCVHDEVTVECAEDYGNNMKVIVENCMKEAFKDVFPNGIVNGLVEAKIGNSWGAAK